MSNNPKSTREAPPDSPARDAPPASEAVPFMAFADLFHKGVERLAEMQKNRLDLIASQTSDALAAWKQAFAMPSSAPGMFLLDLADQGIGKMAETQKGIIDLVVQQSSQTMDLSKERRDSASKWTSGVAAMMSDAVDTAVAAHKTFLDFSAEQNKVVAATLKRQAGVAGSTPGAAAVDTIQRNVEMAIQTQKELMEAAAKPLKAAAAKQAA